MNSDSRNGEVYLDTYVLQQDMRIRLPKTILANLNATKGKTKFDIYFDPTHTSLILRVHSEPNNGGNDE